MGENESDKPKESPLSENAVGRPSKYTPDMCDRLVQLMSQGYSIEASAGALGVHKDTIYEWVKTYPDFSDAKKLGESMSQFFWEGLGIDHIINKSDSESDPVNGGWSKSRSLNATVWIFNMKNRFKWKSEVVEAGERDKPKVFTLNYERNKRKPEAPE